MADKVPRLNFTTTSKGALDCRSHPDGGFVHYSDYAKLKAMHADIIDQGRKVQIAASGESKYGAMSDSEFIEWMLNWLEGRWER